MWKKWWSLLIWRHVPWVKSLSLQKKLTQSIVTRNHWIFGAKFSKKLLKAWMLVSLIEIFNSQHGSCNELSIRNDLLICRGHQQQEFRSFSLKVNVIYPRTRRRQDECSSCRGNRDCDQESDQRWWSQWLLLFAKISKYLSDFDLLVSKQPIPVGHWFEANFTEKVWLLIQNMLVIDQSKMLRFSFYQSKIYD